MTTVVLAMAVAFVVLVLVKVLYWMFISYTLAEDPRADELHRIETDDRWQVQLARYKPAGDEGEPILVVPGAFGNQFSLTSPAGDSVVDVLRERGYDCWVIDLRGSRSSQAPLGKSRFDVSLDDYLQYDLPAAIAFIRKTTGFRQVHWVGHSMGGVLLYAYELMHGDKHIASGATLAAPPGFANLKLRRWEIPLSLIETMPGICELWVRAVAPLIPLLRLNTPIKPFNWSNVHKGINASVFYNMVEILPPQVADSLSFAAAKHQLRVNDDHTDVISGLKTLQIPLLSIYGVSDCFIPEANARIFFEALPKKDKKMIMLSKANGCEQDYGHADVALGANGRDEVYGAVADWFDAHSSVGKLSITDSEGVLSMQPDADASWRKALRRAADVMSDFNDDDEDMAVPAPAAKSTGKTKAKTARRKAAAKNVKAKTPAKKKTTAKKKTAAKKKSGTNSAAKKTTVKKKAAVKKKTAAKKKAGAKKPAAKKPAAKKKTVAKK